MKHTKGYLKGSEIRSSDLIAFPSEPDESMAAAVIVGVLICWIVTAISIGMIVLTGWLGWTALKSINQALRGQNKGIINVQDPNDRRSSETGKADQQRKTEGEGASEGQVPDVQPPIPGEDFQPVF